MVKKKKSFFFCRKVEKNVLTMNLLSKQTLLMQGFEVSRLVSDYVSLESHCRKNTYKKTVVVINLLSKQGFIKFSYRRILARVRLTLTVNEINRSAFFLPFFSIVFLDVA